MHWFDEPISYSLLDPSGTLSVLVFLPTAYYEFLECKLYSFLFINLVQKPIDALKPMICNAFAIFNASCHIIILLTARPPALALSVNAQSKGNNLRILAKSAGGNSKLGIGDLFDCRQLLV